MARFDHREFLRLFEPKLVSVLREGYGLQALRADATKRSNSGETSCGPGEASG